MVKLFFIFMICSVFLGKGIFSRNSPEDRCTAAGDLVCYDCNTIGLCEGSVEDGFQVVQQEQCFSSTEKCDSSFVEGVCFALPPSSECFCQDVDGDCKVDINNDQVIIDCPSEEPQAPCDVIVDLNACACASDFSTTTQPSGGSPEERCEADGDKVCLSCGLVGTCVRVSDGTFVVTTSETCSGASLCDSSIADGICVPLSPSISSCSCDEGEVCRVDVNNPLGLFDCATGETTFCPEAVDPSSCTCTTANSCPPCGFAEYPNDCNWYYYCAEGDFVLNQCPLQQCFDPTFCTCE